METIFSAAITLFLVMDPLGNIPIFISVLKEVAPERRRIVLIRELFISLVVLVTFLFLGQPMLQFLHLRQEAISIAGGIVLFLIAIRMIFPSDGGIMGEQMEGEPFIVPLAIPLVAGPSAMATVLLISRSDSTRIWYWLAALLLAWTANTAILLMSNLFYRLLRRRGVIAIERLMGMLLVMLSVQMFLDGVAEYLGYTMG